MCNFKVIFVAGVHGVGKNYFCSKVGEILKLSHFSASSLIKEEKHSAVDINKNVLDLDKNQDYLIHAVSKIKTASTKIIIDGHFCLFNNGEIVNISLQLFEKLPLDSIIVLYDSAPSICQRLQQRDKKIFSIDMIYEMQEQEIKRAEYIATYLNIPFEKFHFSNIEQFCRTLKIIQS